MGLRVGWFLSGVLAATLLLLGQAAGAADYNPLPIVFVHGNGDTAGSWITTIWRFESNGYPRSLMDAIDLRYPVARDRDDTPQAGRSSTADVMHQLAAEVSLLKTRTRSAKVVLIGQSRGGNTVRNYLKNGGGAANVAMTVLAGAVNHGVVVSDAVLVGSEFNGAGAFMRDLNGSPDEVVPGVSYMTIRSTNNDKYAQPDGRYFGLPAVQTGVGFEGPALKGALNIALPLIDHRETGYAPQAFLEMYRFVTGNDPKTLDIVPEPHPVLDGKVTGFEAGQPTNIAVAGARVEIYEVAPGSGERIGAAAHEKTTAADGQWGPFAARGDAYYEFVVSVPGLPVTHIYRSPFPRSSRYVNLRPQPVDVSDQGAAALVYMTRPRGYFGIGRDVVLLDNRLPAGLAQGVPSVAAVRTTFEAVPDRPVVGIFNQEGIAARAWPAKDNQVSVIELTY
jgi:pimeloyl-ACP methyl ester carboxylesterase